MKKFSYDLKKKANMKGRIETFCNTDQNLYVGTNTGHIYVFFIQPEGVGYNIRLVQEMNISKSKIHHIVVDEEWNLLFALHDSRINTYKISPKFVKKNEIEETHRCSYFDRNKRKLVVFKLRKIYIFKYYRKNYEYELIQEIKPPVPKILRLRWEKQYICISSASNFYLLDCKTGNRHKSLEDQIRLDSLVDFDYLYKCLDFASIFGLIQSQYSELPLSDVPPVSCGLCFPYIVFVSSKGTIDCYNLYQKKMIQSYPFHASKTKSRVPKNSVNFKGFLISENSNAKRCIVVGREKILILTPFDVDKQIRILIKENRVEESLKLFNKTVRGKYLDKSSPTYVKQINGIYETAGFELIFHSEEYHRGFSFFKRMGAEFDPREVIFLFPDLVPKTKMKKKCLDFEQKRTKNFLLTCQEMEEEEEEEEAFSGRGSGKKKSTKFWDFKEGDKVDIQLIIQSYFFSVKKISPTERDIMKNYHNLRKALTKYLSRGLKVGLFIPSQSSQNGPPPQSSLEVLEVVKYALLKLYMTETKNFDAVKDLMKNWKVISRLPEGNLDEEFVRLVKDTNPVLLSYFFWSDGKQREALELLKEKRPNEDVMTNGMPEMIELLSECEDEALVMENVPFIIEHYTESVIQSYHKDEEERIKKGEDEGKKEEEEEETEGEEGGTFDDWDKVNIKQERRRQTLNITDILNDDFDARLKTFDAHEKLEENERKDREKRRKSYRKSGSGESLEEEEGKMESMESAITDDDLLRIFISEKRERMLNPELVLEHLSILPDDMNRKYLEHLVFEKKLRNKKYVTLLILNYIVTIKRMKPLQLQRETIWKDSKKKKKGDDDEDDEDEGESDEDEGEEEEKEEEEEEKEAMSKDQQELYDYDVGKASEETVVEKSVKITPGTEFGLLGKYRKNLLQLLKDEHLKYDENEVLRHLLYHHEEDEEERKKKKKKKKKKKAVTNILLEELLYLFKKMNNHRSALELLLFEKRDEHAAREYCIVWYDQQQALIRRRNVHHREGARKGFILGSGGGTSTSTSSTANEDPSSTTSIEDENSGGLEYNPLWIILLDLCFNQEPKNEKFGLYIMKKYAHMINPMEALNILPKKKYQIRQLVDFLSTIIENSISKNRREKLMYHMQNYLYVKEKAKRAKFNSRRIVIRENSRCIVCRKLIGENRAFVVYPDMSICHRYCVPKKKNILHHPTSNRNFGFFPVDIDKMVEDQNVLHPSHLKY